MPSPSSSCPSAPPAEAALLILTRGEGGVGGDGGEPLLSPPSCVVPPEAKNGCSAAIWAARVPRAAAAAAAEAPGLGEL